MAAAWVLMVTSPSDHGKDVDGEPLVPIPAAHFQEYGFDVVQLAEADNYDILSYRPDVSQSAAQLATRR
jgi:hypothetical protein